MPLVPTAVVAVPTKPKIGFSIDSIVGDHDKVGSPADVEPMGSVASTSPPGSPGLTPPPPSSTNNTGTSSPPSAHAIVRPSPGYDAAALKQLYGLQDAVPPPHPPPQPHPHGHHHPHHHPLALVAAAQHFQAAGLAAALGHPPPPPPPGFAAAAAGAGPPTHHHPPRDTYPLYPWLLSRHGRIFPHRFPAGRLATPKHLQPLAA